MQTVLELNANPNAKDSIGRSPLHFACKRGSLDHFNILIQIEEIEIDAQTNAGVTPLMCAVQSGNIQLVAACLNNHMNPFLKDGLETTALAYASRFVDVLGIDMRSLISEAMEQWQKQTTEAERMESQIELSSHFQDYIPYDNQN